MITLALRILDFALRILGFLICYIIAIVLLFAAIVCTVRAVCWARLRWKRLTRFRGPFTPDGKHLSVRERARLQEIQAGWRKRGREPARAGWLLPDRKDEK